MFRHKFNISLWMLCVAALHTLASNMVSNSVFDKCLSAYVTLVSCNELVADFIVYFIRDVTGFFNKSHSHRTTNHLVSITN